MGSLEITGRLIGASFYEASGDVAAVFFINVTKNNGCQRPKYIASNISAVLSGSIKVFRAMTST